MSVFSRFSLFVAAASLAAVSIVSSAPKADASNTTCDTYDWGRVCGKTISGSVERVGFEHKDGSWFVGDITCTGSEWILHSGWTGTINKATASTVAKAYCEGRGSMFVGA